MDVGKVAVTEDLDIGIVGLQRTKQGDEGMLLCWRAGVGRVSVLVETALIADADTVSIIPSACVGTHHLFGAADMQLSVAGDVVVVAAAPPSFGLVAGIQRLERETTVAPCRRAVNNNQINLSHNNLGAPPRPSPVGRGKG